MLTYKHILDIEQWTKWIKSLSSGSLLIGEGNKWDRYTSDVSDEETDVSTVTDADIEIWTRNYVAVYIR